MVEMGGQPSIQPDCPPAADDDRAERINNMTDVERITKTYDDGFEAEMQIVKARILSLAETLADFGEDANNGDVFAIVREIKRTYGSMNRHYHAARTLMESSVALHVAFCTDAEPDAEPAEAEETAEAES